MAAPLLLSGCGGMQSALNPHGPVARTLAETWWVMLAGGSVVLLLVTLLTLYAVIRRPEARRQVDGNTLIALGGVALPLVTLTALLIYGVHVGDRVQRPLPDALRVQIIGHQWWWEVRYPDYGNAITANEIHIPAGQPIRIELISADVIHSFWAPTLAGKIDLLPGQHNRLWLQADEPGVYRGQCAEFCGAQHAHMAFLVIAQPEADFHAWLARQQQPATRPATATQARGLAAFSELGCGQCHTLRGAGASGALGPDLTHVGSRRTLAAASLENTPGNMAHWIAANQQIKPGNAMPSFTHLDPAVLEDLAAFLGSLQ